jgi:hypothetical protein
VVPVSYFYDGSGDDGFEPFIPGGPVQWVTIAQFPTPHDAHLARSFLAADGIPVRLRDENLVGVNWLMSPALGGVRLDVPEEFVARARDLLAHRMDP